MKKGITFICIVLITLSMFFSPIINNNVSFAQGASTLRVGWTVEPDSLSPFISYRAVTFELIQLLYDSLIAYDNDLTPVGKLAESWEVSDDNLTWTFKLIEGVKWHDGEPLTSRDVKFSYETLLESKMGMYSDFLLGITSIETPDDLTVLITTEEPKANMLHVTAPILPMHIWKDVEFDELEIWPNDKPIGTGPFKFVEWKKGEYVKLEANKDYFLGAPKVDELIHVLYASNDTMVQSLKIGEIDAAININPNQLKSLGEQENIQVISNPTNGFNSLAINSWKDEASKGNPLLLNNSIKHAIEYAINKQQIIDVSYSGQGKPGTTIVPSFLSDWHHKLSEDKARSYNTDRSNEILDQAGFTDQNGDGIREDEQGNPLEFRLYLRSKTPEEVKAGQMIHSMLKEVGIETKIETMDDGVLVDRIYNDGDFDFFIWGWSADIDPTTILSVVTTEQIGNLSDTFYSNPKYDELLYKQGATIDFEERQKIVYEMQDILAEDLPYIILMEENSMQAVRTDKWEGWTSIQGTFLMAANNYNYLHVSPILEENGLNGTASSTNSNSINSSWFIFGGLGIAIVLIAIGVRVRKRKGIDRFDTM